MLKLLLTMLTKITMLTVAQHSLAAPAPLTLDDMRKALDTQSAMVIDIREPFEHATGVAKGAVLMPMRTIGARLAELPKPDAQSAGKPLLVVCNTQNRSANIVGQLQAAGYTNARYVHGGMSEWKARGLPMQSPQ